MTAFHAATGAVAWRQTRGARFTSSEPTVFDGRLYVTGIGAFDAKTGALLFPLDTSPDHNSAAVSELGVFMGFSRNLVWAFDRHSGRILWGHQEGCDGGGGRTLALAEGRLYTRDFLGNRVLDAATGTVLGDHVGTRIPAFSEGTGYFAALDTLTARHEGSGMVQWSVALRSEVSAAPIVVGDHLVVGTDQRLIILDKRTGTEVGADTVRTARPDEQNVSVPVSGLSAAGGRLFVPVGEELVAYQGPKVDAFEPAVSGGLGEALGAGVRRGRPGCPRCPGAVHLAFALASSRRLSFGA